MKVLVTGGIGYIGSHTVVELLESGHDVVVVDNLCSSSFQTTNKIKEISGREFEFHQIDLRDKTELNRVFEVHTNIEAVIHFAGLKSVEESIEKPLSYYSNNVVATTNLCEAMTRVGVKKLIFSSSATVYGDKNTMPVKESDLIGKATNPYGSSKIIIENMLTELACSDPDWQIISLRYFNPVGAHQSGLIGENPLNNPTNLVPCVANVAIGRLEKLKVYGNDYPTEDGTAVRDFIHVLDLAAGHLKALERLSFPFSKMEVFNLGTGLGHSVLEVVEMFREISGRAIPIRFSERRDGDVATSWADVRKANEVLNWYAKRSLEQMIIDAWRWNVNHNKSFELSA
ncbi:MAG: UDP-glucose 4-epimerase GalE [Alteromonadaceae bacterium]|nr:UDP-glucose 4-epimerase GalE [Alteromonadaceae bacterium]